MQNGRSGRGVRGTGCDDWERDWEDDCDDWELVVVVEVGGRVFLAAGRGAGFSPVQPYAAAVRMSSTLVPSGTSGWNTKAAAPWSSSAMGETYARPEMDIPLTNRPWPGWRRTMEAASVGSTRASSWTNCLSGHVSGVVAVVGMGWGGVAGRLSKANTASVVGPAKKKIAAEGGSTGTGGATAAAPGSAMTLGVASAASGSVLHCQPREKMDTEGLDRV